MSRRAGIALAVGPLLAAACSGGSSGFGLDPNDVTLLDVQAQVFSPRCALSGCHIGGMAPFGLDLSSGNAGGNTVGVQAAEVPALMRVDPYDPDGSYLYLKISGDPSILGDPMPADGSSLTPSDIDLVRTWIEQGAR